MIKKIITGKLRALTGIHIGSGDTTETTDLPIFRDVVGDILIPGTAIAGALRTSTTRIAPHLGFDKCLALEPSSKDFCDCDICDLFGSINPGKDLEEDKAKASKIWVYNAVLTSNAKTLIRDGVGIDRESKSSARTIRVKYDFEIVPKDSVFTFRVDLQDNVSKEQESLLASILSEWTRGRSNLGGDVARGLGNMQLEDIKVYNLDLSSIDQLMAFLREDDPIKIGTEEKDWLSNHGEEAKKLIEETVKRKKLIVDNDYLYNSFAQIEFILQFTGGFVINDILSSTRSGYEFCPKIENGNFALPGSTLRGVLRSHAEKIARSLTTLNSSNGDDFLAKCPACSPHADENNPLTSCNILFRKNRKSPEEEIKDDQLCLACRLFGSSYKASRLYIRDGYLPVSSKIEIKIMDFLAIDRFTGGGKEGAKFDALVLWQPAFEIRMFLENPREWQLGWLFLVLRDLKDELLPVGFGQSKWFGKTETKDEKIKIGTISNDFVPQELKMDNHYEGIFNTKTWNFEELIKEPEKPVEIWIKEFHNELQKFRRVKGFIPSSDTYFREDMTTLYPGEVR